MSSYHQNHGDVTANFGSQLQQVATSFSSLATTTPSLHFYMGNEAGDADSIISSLALAYTKNLEYNSSSNVDAYKNIPLVSIPRSDMALRRETVLLLQMAGISTEQLLYLDDASVQSFLKEDTSTASSTDMALTLVDHNKIRNSLSHLSDRVVEIVDHHADEEAHRHIVPHRRKIAFEHGHATAGSACTLVTENLLEHVVRANNKIDAGVGLGLLGVILIDTMNMSAEAGKGTDRDANAISNLVAHTDWTQLQPFALDEKAADLIFPKGLGMAPDCTELHDYLRDCKFDPEFWKELSVKDCLRIDYKRFESSSDANKLDNVFGLSSILLSLNDFMSKSHLTNHVAEFMQRANVALLGILSMKIGVDGTPNREMLLFGSKNESDTDHVDSMVQYLIGDEKALFLKMKDVPIGTDFLVNVSSLSNPITVRRLYQGNAKGSRKQMAPVMLEYYKN
jgi:exopolyphosphatase